jgi:hypothetical protein
MKLDALLQNARSALAGLNTPDRSVAGLVNRIAALRFSEGTLVGFLDALTLTDPQAARLAAPRIEAFISEAIAARIFLE